MESFVGENCPEINFTNESCIEFSEEDFWAVVGCRTGISIAGVVLSALVIVFIIRLKFYLKVELKHDGRLGLYLCTASLLNGVFTAFQIVPVRSGLKCGHVVAHNFCIAVSVLITYSVWTILVLMVWVYVEIIMAILLAVSKAKHTETHDKLDHQRDENSRCCINCINMYISNSKCYDVCVLLTTVFIPFIFCFVPLAKPKLYGLSGAWCWIQSRDDQCQEIDTGFKEQLALWYVWAMAFISVFVATTLVSILFVVCKMICKKKKYESDVIQTMYCRYLKDIWPLFICPLIFTVIYAFGFGNRIYYYRHPKTIDWLWILHGIADAIVSLVISLYFLLYYLIKLKKRRLPEARPLLGYDDLVNT